MKYLKHVSVLVTVAFLLLFSIKVTIAQIVINELGVLGTPDWIELYAYEDIDISGWYLDDVGTSSKIYTFPGGTVVGPSTNPIITENVSDRLNNSGDTIGLYRSDATLVEQIRYGGNGVCLPVSSEGSVGKTTDGGNVLERFSQSSFNASNASGTLSPCPSPTPIPTQTPTNTPTPTVAATNAPTNTPTPNPTSTKKSTSTPTKKPTLTPQDHAADNELLQKSADVSQFRYDSENNSDQQTPADVLGAESSSDLANISPFAYVLLGLGIVFVGVSVFLFVKNRRQNR